MSTSKTYISRHVKFLENSFPFTTHQSYLARPTPKLISNGLPLVQTITISNGSLNMPPQNSETSSASIITPPTHQNTHPMTTRAKNNIHKPLTKMNLTAIISQPSGIEPHTVNQALTDPKWRQAMNDEFDALVQNGTWKLLSSTSM